MGIPNLTQAIDNLYVTTFANVRPGIIDNIFNATPFWKLMTMKGRAKEITGGKWIEQALEYAKNSTIKAIVKGDTVDIVDDEFLTAAFYNWKYITGSIVRYMVDDQVNANGSKIRDLVEAKMKNLKNSLIGYLDTEAFGDGTDDGGKTIEGLAKLISITPTTGVVGGINSATNAWWRNYVYNMGSDSTALYLRKKMVTAWNTVGIGGEGLTKYPDLTVTDQATYELYEDELFEIKMIVDNKNGIGDLGFGDLYFKGKNLVWSDACTTGYMYFVNTAYLNWVYDPGYYFMMDEWKPIPNQVKDRVTQILAVGNLTCSNRKKQGVIYGIGTTP